MLKLQQALSCVLTLLMLSGCGNSGGDVDLVEIPSDIRICFEELTDAPDQGPKTKQDVVRLIGELRKSEQRQSSCGQRLIAWYDAQKDVFEKRSKSRWQ